LEPIYPLNEERIRPFCGNLVCVLMKDGTRHVGVLSSCGKGRIILNGELEGAGAGPGGKLHLKERRPREKRSASVSRKRGSKGKKAAPTAETQAYPFGYGGGAGFYGPRYPLGAKLVLDLALIAFLFLLF